MNRPAIGFAPVPGSAYLRQPLKQYRWDGQPARCPRRGEFYLSGAVVHAYQAKHDLSTPYYIAVPVTDDKE